MELVIDKKSYQIFDSCDHQTTKKHLQQKGKSGMEQSFHRTDQQKADAGSEKHGNMRVSPVENFDSTVKKAPCEKYNGICLYWSKCHRNTMPFWFILRAFSMIIFLLVYTCVLMNRAGICYTNKSDQNGNKFLHMEFVLRHIRHRSGMCAKYV